MVTFNRTCVSSADGRYRYCLRMQWSMFAGPLVNFVMLNPSTADIKQDDATVRRCAGFASAWGYGRMAVTNLFALRSTDPDGLSTAGDPVGRDNDNWVRATALEAELVVAAWGDHRQAKGRDAEVLAILAGAGKAVHCLVRTASGAPGHPVRLPNGLKPVIFADKPTTQRQGQ